MIDNLELIKSLLEFDEDTFYMVQIIKRKKEHPDLGSNNYMVKAYYVDSIEKLEKDYPEMQCLAKFHNARVMINLNKRSYEKLAFQNLKKVADQIMNKDYKSVKKAYNTVAGQFASEPNKKWIIDIDDPNYRTIDTVLDALKETYDDMRAVKDGKIYGILPTKNGFHVICSPFNTSWVSDDILVHDIHCDNPTILYIP